MKKSLFYILILFSALLHAQQREDVILNWTETTSTTVGDYTVSIPHFDASYMDFNASAGVLLFRYGIAVGGKLDDSSLRITNLVYEDVSAVQLGGLNRANMPSAINAVLSSVNARGQWSARLSLNPIIKSGSGYKRVKSFTFTYDNDRNAQRSTAAANVISNSVLNSGGWHRFYVEKSGVYKITRAFLSSLGFDTNTDPRTIKIYGNGGRMLPMSNSTYYPMDLAENAVRFVGEEDGVFDSNDYILFYAEGVDNWNAESRTNNNLFSDRSYYYVTAGASPGKRVQALVQPTAAPVITTSVFDEYVYHEKDLVNIARLGRKWHGEAFNVENEQTFEFSVPDIVTTEPVTLAVSAAANSVSSSTMAVEANGAAAGTISFVGTPSSLVLAIDGYYSGTFVSAGSTIKIKLTYNNNGVPSAGAWLDYITLQAKRTLKGGIKQCRFKLNAAQSALGPIKYDFTSAASISEVWDVTDIYNATTMANTTGASFSFTGSGGEVRQYVAVVPSDYYMPLRDAKPRVANQNLKGTIFKNAQGQFQDIDYLIITPQFLNASAESLAAIHRNREGLNVKVVNLESIYEEFSSGKQDIGAIRNFVKYVYNNASSVDKRVKYLNLFGDASFDYKNRIPRNTNIVPTVHGINLSNTGEGNYSLTNTFVTDDFYGAMDDNEGLMTSASDYGLDIAVGRMLVTTVADAGQMINKVVEYLSEESYGRWRNEYVMLADDVDVRGTDVFIDSLEGIAGSIAQYKNFINMRKVYMDAYVQQASSGGQRYPDAKEELLRYINYGALVVNYLGHGSELGMASERIFGATDAQGLTNQYKYPLFITTTCELTKFDNPYLESTGELIYKNPVGGAIAMITTTRAIFINEAKELNKLLSGYLYSYTPTNTYDYPSMAEAFRRTKASVNGPSQFKTCSSFIGDPALHLAVPKINIVLTKINDVPVAESTETLKSLSYVKLSGQVTNEAGVVLSGYNGEVQATVFDKPTARTTLNNDNQDIKRPFTTLGEAIFRGNATVTNGQFDFGFVVPRDIRVPVGNGRVSFYSKKNGVLEDQTGVDVAIRVGGVNPNAEADTTPPTVTLYMNDESFVSGGITNDAPILLAYLADAHGINTSSGIGHDIIGILDGNETSPFLMNDYYEADANDHTRGKVHYPFVNLSKGIHTLTFKAWDVYNNLVTTEIQFVVTGSDELQLEKVLNYPNPFVSYTEFWFNHNRPFEPLDVQVQIFTVTGKIVRTLNQQVTTDGFLSRDVKWDGRDDFGDKIGKGVYIYKLTVRSSSTNKKAEKFEKLVLL